MKEYTNQLALDVTRSRELLIIEAINHQLGLGWTFDIIKGRGKMIAQPDKTEVFSFDGVDLIHFFPLETSIDQSKERVTFRATQKYKLLY